MDKRIALDNGSELIFGGRKYVVENELARGGSSIVYNAYYIDNADCRKKVRIKECYPFSSDIKRNSDNFLIPDEYDKKQFETIKEKLKTAYILGNKLSSEKTLTNSTANTYDIYNANNTVYIISAYMQGKELNYERYDSIKDCVSVVKSTAKVICRIHNEGYLYLDLKPENIFTLDETTSMIQLFDFDSLMPIDVLARDKNEIRIFCTKGYAALELQKGDIEHIGKYTDVFSVGAVLFYMLFGRVPNAVECGKKCCL